MKNFLATWIVFQLIVIGWAGVSVNNDMARGTLSCEPKDLGFKGYLAGTMFPLVFFITETNDHTEYCKNKK